MLNINKNTKIYVYCPGGIVSGGPELLHQLVDYLNNHGLDAYILYYSNKDKKQKFELPLAYKNYNVKVVDKIIDSKDNIEIIPEGGLHKATENKLIQKIFWWLSVDYFYIVHESELSFINLFRFNPLLGLKEVLKSITKNKLNFKRGLSLSSLKKIDAINCYQSEYAQNFLQGKKFKNICALKDYINVDFTVENNIKDKKNKIIYNPKKGLRFTKKLIKEISEYEWVPIQNMSREEVIKNLQEAKLYIDFGFHPGKDRLPRESALNGCCVITSKKGSAAFFEDVMIPDEYKFKVSNKNIPLIVNKITNVMQNYELHNSNFDHYRFMIKNEKDEFENQIKNLFELNY